MTHEDWERELRQRFAAVSAATRSADRWVREGIAGAALPDPLERLERDQDLEDAVTAWQALMEWRRQEPR